MSRKLLDPRLRTSLEDHWPSLCTIRRVKVKESDSGQLVAYGDPVPVVGLVDIPCRLGPIVQERPTDDERRTPSVQSSYQRRHCSLNMYASDIVPRDMDAIVDGVSYPIRGVDSDSEHFLTRLRLEVVVPN